MEEIIDKYKISSKLKLDELFIKLLYVFKGNLFVVANDDKLYAFGHNSWGVLGFGHSYEVKELTLVEELCGKQIIDFKSSDYHMIARTIDGKLYCWGWNALLGNGRNDGQIYKPEVNQYLSNKCIIDICCGFGHSLVLTSDGEVYTWGENYEGQIGNGKNVHSQFQLIPYHVKGFNGEKVKVISCGAFHSIVLTEKGNVFSWGWNKFGQLGAGLELNCSSPKRIEIEMLIIEKIICGDRYSLLLSRDGDIYVFGSNECEQIQTVYMNENQFKTLKLENQNKFIDIASHSLYNTSVALSENGMYYVWGKCGKQVISEPKETYFKTFNEIFAFYHQITYKTIDRLDECLKNLFTLKNQKYHQNFVEKRLISAGYYGSVCEAIDKNSNKIFKIKKIALNGINKDEVCSELSIIAKIKSKYIVECYDFWTEEYNENNSSNLGSKNNSVLLYIQTELYLKSLKEVIQVLDEDLTQNLSESSSLFGYYISSELLIEILESVDYLHKQIPPIIHRDLKPENILITDALNGRFVKLADFGLATICQSGDQVHSECTEARIYAAPEAAYSKYYDSKANIYSLGAITRELFNIDINRCSNSDISSTLRNKYRKMSEIVDRMMLLKRGSRPTCDQILRDKRTWALDSQDLTKLAENQLNALKPSDESFCSAFIQIKLRNIPKKQRRSSKWWPHKQ